MTKTFSFVSLLILSVLIISFNTQDSWVLFQTQKCKVLFPKKPTDQSQTINTAIGKLNLNIYVYEVPDSAKDDNLAYLLSESEYPDTIINSDKKQIIDTFFRHSIDGAVSNVHGKLLTEAIIQSNGFPGREIRVDFRDGLAIIKMRFYLVKNRLYMLETITETKKDFNRSVDKFFESFKFTT